jgi:uncharacterized protein
VTLESTSDGWRPNPGIIKATGPSRAWPDLYSLGHGVPQDYAEALPWYRKAAEQGDANAQFNLGAMYAQGHGVPRDNVEAHMWLSLAASSFRGDDGQESAAVRDYVAGQMTVQQIAEAQRRAREWRPRTR